MDKNWIRGLRCRASEQLIAKPTSIKGNINHSRQRLSERHHPLHQRQGRHVSFKDMNTLTVVTPSLAAGSQHLTITNPDGETVSLDAAITVN